MQNCRFKCFLSGAWHFLLPCSQRSEVHQHQPCSELCHHRAEKGEVGQGYLERPGHPWGQVLGQQGHRGGQVLVQASDEHQDRQEEGRGQFGARSKKGKVGRVGASSTLERSNPQKVRFGLSCDAIKFQLFQEVHVGQKPLQEPFEEGVETGTRDEAWNERDLSETPAKQAAGEEANWPLSRF